MPLKATLPCQDFSYRQHKPNNFFTFWLMARYGHDMLGFRSRSISVIEVACRQWYVYIFQSPAFFEKFFIFPKSILLTWFYHTKSFPLLGLFKSKRSRFSLLKYNRKDPSGQKILPFSSYILPPWLFFVISVFFVPCDISDCLPLASVPLEK